MSGFYFMHRGWQDHPVFGRDPFSDRDAWVWLIEAAAWKPCKKRAGVAVVDLDRGQLTASVRFIATAWQWHRSKVERFLKRLADASMIVTDARHGVTVITLCNYERYQVQQDGSETAAETAPRQRRDSAETNKKKEIREEGKEEPIGSSKTRVTDADFELWYAGYPHKVGKGAARTAYRRARTKAAAEALLIGRDFYVRSKPPDRAWCNPATWLNGERWLDQPNDVRPDETPGRKPSAAQSIFAGFAIALGDRERAADRREDRDPARAPLDAGDGPDDPFASRH